jgi:hypothetical protein
MRPERLLDTVLIRERVYPMTCERRMWKMVVVGLALAGGCSSEARDTHSPQAEAEPKAVAPGPAEPVSPTSTEQPPPSDPPFTAIRQLDELGRALRPKLRIVPGERLATHCGFSFVAPADLEELPGQGIDSCVDEFTTGGCRLSTDYGAYSDPLEPIEPYKDYEAVTRVIDGRQAKLVRASVQGGAQVEFLAGVHFPRPIDDNPMVKLSVVLLCPSAKQRDKALPLLRTLVFGP